MDIISYSASQEAMELAKKNGIVQWTASTGFVVDKFVINDNKLYQCKVAHTSTTTFDVTKFQLIGTLPKTKIGADILTGDVELVKGNGIDFQVDSTSNKITILNKVASATQLGGVKQGVGVKIDADGTISVQPDSVPPAVSSVATTTDGTQIKVVFNEGLSTTYALDSAKFTVHTNTISSVQYDSTDSGKRTVLLTVGTAINYGDALTVDVLSGAVKDVWNNSNNQQLGIVVTNNVPDTTPPGDCTNISTTTNGSNITVKWTDPTDLDWNRTVLVRKTGSFPIDINDGTLIVSSTVRNQYQANGLVDTNGIVTGTTYYYQLFSVDNAGNVNSNALNQFTAVAQTPSQIYSVEWDTVADTMTRLDAASGQTQSFFNTLSPWKDMKRCNLSDSGIVNAYYGDPTFKDDGSNGQVMVEIPKFYYNITSSGNKIKFSISPQPVSGFSINPAFYRDRTGSGTAVEVDKRYFSAYEGYNNSGKLESKAGVTPTVLQTIGTFRTQAQSRGSGWGIIDFNLLFAVQLLYLVEYASFDSQTMIGKGVTSASAKINTGATASLGNASGNNGDGTSGLVAMSYRGIENIYGNLWNWIDGIFPGASGTNSIKIGNKSFNDTANGYTTINGGTLSESTGFGSNILGRVDSRLGFIADKFSGSTTNKMYDQNNFYYGSYPLMHGGAWNGGLNAGMFSSIFLQPYNSTLTSLSCRLAY